jgi:hypothetical protein
MSSDNVRIKVKMGANEVEIEGPKDSLGGLLDLIPLVTGKMAATIPAQPSAGQPALTSQEGGQQASLLHDLPELKVDKGESLPSITTKLFASTWGKTPRRLVEVKAALESYGLVYPRQSVAVALLRLAQEGKLRRFKGSDGEYLYTLSTSLLTPSEGTSVQEGLVQQQ